MKLKKGPLGIIFWFLGCWRTLTRTDSLIVSDLYESSIFFASTRYLKYYCLFHQNTNTSKAWRFRKKLVRFWTELSRSLSNEVRMIGSDSMPSGDNINLQTEVEFLLPKKGKQITCLKVYLSFTETSPWRYVVSPLLITCIRITVRQADNWSLLARNWSFQGLCYHCISSRSSKHILRFPLLAFSSSLLSMGLQIIIFFPN